MIKPSNHIPAVIVGGGPVGLFLAICLLKRGIVCKVLEKRLFPVRDSRSIGIHPISLDLFDETGITAAFLERGLKIKKGIALSRDKKPGEIVFDNLPKPHNYILSCPQFYTEQILRDELAKLDAEALITDAEFQHFEEIEQSVTTVYRSQQAEKRMTSDILIGCDGKNSLVRQQASIHFSGKKHPDTYIMGDFEDTTDFGTDAAVFLPKEGLIESFPLPENKRRWVVKTDSYRPNPTKKELLDLIRNRIDYDLSDAENTMLSSFKVQYLLAEKLVKGRIILAGDAAHVVSPIGGQGMNLGWLGASRLSEELAEINLGNFDASDLEGYETAHQKIVRKAARRAEFNMRIGRKTSLPFFRNLLVKAMLKPPFSKKTAELFAMRGLVD